MPSQNGATLFYLGAGRRNKKEKMMKQRNNNYKEVMPSLAE
jgi:hypothetical protein